MSRLFADARLVELRAALTRIIDLTYALDDQNALDLDTIRTTALEALERDEALRQRMESEGVAPLPPGARQL